MISLQEWTTAFKDNETPEVPDDTIIKKIIDEIENSDVMRITEENDVILPAILVPIANQARARMITVIVFRVDGTLISSAPEGLTDIRQILPQTIIDLGLNIQTLKTKRGKKQPLLRDRRFETSQKLRQMEKEFNLKPAENLEEMIKNIIQIQRILIMRCSILTPR